MCSPIDVDAPHGKSGSPKGAQKGKGKSTGKAPSFDGDCTYCWKYGHKREDCRQLHQVDNDQQWQGTKDDEEDPEVDEIMSQDVEEDTAEPDVLYGLESHAQRSPNEDPGKNNIPPVKN